MGNAFKGCLGHQHNKKPKTLTLVPSHTKKTLLEALRSPTFVSCADASFGSSPKSSLSSFFGDEYMHEQLQCLSLFQNELLPFFELWDKLQSLSKDNYFSFCSQFYLNLSDTFIAQNDEAFLDDDDPAASGKLMLDKINIIIDRLRKIYHFLGEYQNMSVTESMLYLQRQQTFKSLSSRKYEVEDANKNEAARLMQQFQENELIHLQIEMFDESSNALESAIDAISPQLIGGEFTLSSRGGLRIFFEITRSLMLKHDLSDVQNILSSVGGDQRMNSMNTNKHLIDKFVAFWDYNIFQSMGHRDQQLFSLKIYSFLIKRLQDEASGHYAKPPKSNSTTMSFVMDKSSVLLEQPTQNESEHHLTTTWISKSESIPSPIQNTDENVMKEFHANSRFNTTISIGLVPWLNFLVLFLKLDKPKKLFIHLKNIKRTYKRMNIDINIFEPLAFAFKCACYNDDKFYVKDPNTFHKSKVCLVDDAMEECIDFVFDLFLSELLSDFGRADSVLSQFTMDRSMINYCKKIGMSQIYNAAASNASSPNMIKSFSDHISPLLSTVNHQNLLHKNIACSLAFWQSNVTTLSQRIKQKLSDNIFELISLHSHQFLPSILKISSTIGTNINIIDLLDAYIFQKVQKYSHNSQHFNFCENDDDDGDLWSDKAEITSDYKHSARGRDSHPNTPLPSDASHDLFIDFIAFENDEDVKRGIKFIEQHKVKPIIFKICRSAITEVLQKHFGIDVFDKSIRENFTLLLRTISSLIVGS